MDGEQIARDVAERVRELIADAEERAAEIVSAAEADAKRIRETAEGEASKRLDEVRTALNDLQGKLGGPGAEVTPGPVTVPEPAPPDIPEPTPDPVPEPVPTPEPVPEPSPDPAPAPVPPEDEPGGSETSNGGLSTDKSAARLVAMKMALDGSSREEIEAHLEANYSVEHRDKLLDDVLARAKG